ncbi:3-hydroxylacyl-ACP dehydratase [Neptunicella sp. SCSIO 80796]|uniref:ApeP family dehydratase n=1 Tax=Neptunicella plasticusilytica TaxID=3117012 RepID=UPI003A4D9B5E
MYLIENVIPHRAPMILLDELVSFDQQTAVCRVAICSDSPFFDQERQLVPNHVGIEYMAQSIAAYAGAHEKDQGHQIQVGFLLGSRKYRSFCDGFAKGMELTIKVTLLYQEESGLSVFDCQILQRDRLLAEAKVNTFQPKDSASYIQQSQ